MLATKTHTLVRFFKKSFERMGKKYNFWADLTYTSDKQKKSRITEFQRRLKAFSWDISGRIKDYWIEEKAPYKY